MSELRSSGPEPAGGQDFLHAKARLGNKLNGLLASLDPKTRAAILALATADATTRAGVLAKLDPQTRSTMQLILDSLG
jgi:hypothetical protein